MTIEERYQQLLQDDEKREKYDKPGVYSISIDDKLVYIGKSHNMLHRIAEHIDAIGTGRPHKYFILQSAIGAGHAIQFDVIHYAKAKNPYTELFRVEAYYISRLRPPLNVQIPDPKNYRSCTINEAARHITLDQILESQ